MDEQHYLDIITNETSRLQSLRESHNIEVNEIQKRKKNDADAEADDAEQSRIEELRAEKIAFEKECSRDAEEKKSLLQAVINESRESGFPMPPSLIKLLNHTNGKYIFIYYYSFLWTEFNFR